LTVAEIFQFAGLSSNGPVRWRIESPEDPPELKPGVYLVARVGDPTEICTPCELPLDHVPESLFDSAYEGERWLRSESVVYVGKTDRSIRERVAEFRRQKCGRPGSHHGGQIIKLPQCDLWAYWSPADDPLSAEFDMLCGFKQHTGKLPFGNEYQGANRKRIRVGTDLP
jgi:hypothetical protein